jgi:predicted DCC family thiol-disulfide oxidoreductase YuxK
MAYTYRSDPAVPLFHDSAPLIIFDGHCVLCSTGV